MDKLVDLLKPVSPALAAALSGDSGPLALRVLGREVVGDDQADADAIAAALSNADATTPLKIKSAETAFLQLNATAQLELARIQAQASAKKQDTLVAMETIAASDRASARQRQMSLNDKTSAYLAYLITASFVLVLVLIVLGPRLGIIPAQDNAVAQTLLGVLGTGWASVVSYYFGSSVGSKEKNAVLAESATPPKTIGVGS